MNPAPPSYGQLIANRYQDCSHPLSRLLGTIFAPPLAATSFSQSDLAQIATHVTQGQELSRDCRDIHGRLDEAFAPANRGAAVDDLLVTAAAPCPTRRFSVVITHDVDRTTLCEATAIAKRILGVCRSRRQGTTPTDNCGTTIARTIDALLQFESDNNIRSIFFFLSGPYSLARYGSRTSARWASTQTIIRAVKAAGMEIGLHGSYYAMENDSYGDECRRLADTAQTIIRHHRNHYLRYNPSHFWKQLSSAGLAVDHSVGFTSGWGLRSGTCVPYPTYDYTTQALSRIIELPMLLMDGTWSQQLDLTNIGKIRCLLETVRRHHGCVGINFHPESLATNPTVWEYFKRIIGICRELGADMMLPSDLSTAN